MKKLIKVSAISLIMAGICFAIPNTFILPFVDFKAPFSELLTSTPFLYRMIIAALTVAFLLFGSIGIYLYHNSIERTVLFRYISFMVAFFGSAFMLANEWHQIFVLPEIALIDANAPNLLGASTVSERYNIGAMMALSTFSFGWILFCISLIISKHLKRLGPSLVIAGFLLIPLFSGIIDPIIGGIIGGVCLGLGFILMGLEILRMLRIS